MYVAVEGMLQQYRERPDEVAVGDGARDITYREYVEAAGGIATLMARHADRLPVVMLVDRNLDAAVAALATHWAGRGLIPIDVDEPLPRLERILDRVGPCHLYDASGRAPSTVLGRPVTSTLDVAPGFIDPVPVEQDDICTVFFTSGSTGEPKGVVRTVAQSEISWHALTTDFLDGWHHLANFFSPHFIPGYAFMFIHPAVGKRVTLIDLRTHAPAAVGRIVDEVGIDCLLVTPSLAHALVRGIRDERRLHGVHRVLIFGEPLDWAEVESLRSLAADDVTVHSLYTSSEALAYLLHNPVTRDVPAGTGLVPLGREYRPGTVRFEQAEGSDDLYEVIAVRDVLPQYLADPTLSANRFGVTEDGEPFWRSGDLVSLVDGEIHYRGRVDDMVKVNGRLVEPAEAERVLRTTPGVRNAVLLPRRLPSGRQQFVAHLECDDTVTADALRRTLRAALPPHLVPAVMVRHEQLPLTDRGKVDRNTLRTAAITPWRAAGSDAPADAFERAVTAIAAQVLGLDDLGTDDNLWDMGCDSLAAIEIAEVVSRGHAHRLEANDLIAATTPRAIARLLERSTPGHQDPVVVVNPEAPGTPVFVIAGAGGPALQYRALATVLSSGRPAVIIEQLGLHRRGERDRDTGAFADRVAAEVFARADGRECTLVGHSYGGLVAHEAAVRLREKGHHVRLVVLDTMLTFDALSPLRLMARTVRRRGRAIGARPGTVRWFAARFEESARHMRRHTPRRFDGPSLLVITEGGSNPDDWKPYAPFAAIRVHGDHLSMITPPFVSEVAAAVGAFESTV